MNNRETGCFAICAKTGCLIADLENLKAKGVQLVATIKKKSEEQGYEPV